MSGYKICDHELFQPAAYKWAFYKSGTAYSEFFYITQPLIQYTISLSFVEFYLPTATPVMMSLPQTREMRECGDNEKRSDGTR